MSTSLCYYSVVAIATNEVQRILRATIVSLLVGPEGNKQLPQMQMLKPKKERIKIKINL